MKRVDIRTILIADDDAHFDADFITGKHLQRLDVHEGISIVVQTPGVESLAEPLDGS